jgi:6-pyruvoyltetrahydropterin/6-carboxytetrahydropterin synthase
MKVKISKRFDFDAAHRLPTVAPDHKCFRMHGHTYGVEIFCAGEADARGMVCDYAEIAEAWKPIHDAIDHRTLNEIEGLEVPTTEILTPWIGFKLLDALPAFCGVRVYESSTTYCEVTADELRYERGSKNWKPA